MRGTVLAGGRSVLPGLLNTVVFTSIRHSRRLNTIVFTIIWSCRTLNNGISITQIPLFLQAFGVLDCSFLVIQKNTYCRAHFYMSFTWLFLGALYAVQAKRTETARGPATPPRDNIYLCLYTHLYTHTTRFTALVPKSVESPLGQILAHLGQLSIRGLCAAQCGWAGFETTKRTSYIFSDMI